MTAPMLTEDELTVLRALDPSNSRSAEVLRLTTHYDVPALVRLLEDLERGGYVEVAGPRGDAAATEYVLTYEGTAEVKP